MADTLLVGRVFAARFLQPRCTMFLIQSLVDKHQMKNEVVLWKELLNPSDYIEISVKQINNIQVKNPIPLGSLEFTQKVLKSCYGIDKIYPIEIPLRLRTNEFLKRNYKICSFSEISDGYYFVKDVSDLKLFSSLGQTHSFKNKLDSNHLFQTSEPVDIKAEYRVCVIDGDVDSISFYNGDPLVFPDVGLITKANYLYSLQSNYPKSYTMDVAVTDKGTCILECHIMFACGIYTTVLGRNFMTGYKHALNYVLTHNEEIKPFSNWKE